MWSGRIGSKNVKVDGYVVVVERPPTKPSATQLKKITTARRKHQLPVFLYDPSTMSAPKSWILSMSRRRRNSLLWVDSSFPSNH
jgi:hypothetical protein